MKFPGIIPTLFFSLLLAGCTSAYVEQAWEGPAVDFAHGNLRVSENGHFLVHRDGTPFSWFGDTAWEVFGRLDSAEVAYYLENRRAKGFTVIQAVILKELDRMDSLNRLGLRPFPDGDPTHPDEAFFSWIDRVIRMAGEKGLYIGLLPTWGDKVDRQWGSGPEIFTPRKAEIYGQWLGERYRDYPNIIWINGGDRSGGGDNFAVWDALARGIKSADPNHLMTYHPQGEHSSSMWFDDSDWLDINTFQSGHAQRDYAIYRRLLVPDYDREPPRPVFDSEPRYENIPIGFDLQNGRFTAHDTRMAMYQSLFSGAFGHTYGANEVWQMYDTLRNPVLGAEIPWREALDYEGAGDVIHARRLLETYDFLSRKPAPEIVLSGNTDDGDRTVATRGKGYALVYFPWGHPAGIALENSGLRGTVRLFWYDPRTGEKLRGETVSASDEFYEAVPPTEGAGNDWILILEQTN